MKKAFVSVVAVAALAGCAYDYYEGGVRYTQDGNDCIYYAGEFGNHFNSEIRGLDTSKRIVYRNTRCEDLYARDMFGQAARADRQILVPAAEQVSVAPSCGCKNACSMPQPIVRHKYVIVPAK